jgi:hypothetical protein
MEPDLKLPLFFASVLVLALLGLYMILVRTLANLEYAVDRLEEIVTREIQIRRTFLEKQRELALRAREGDKNARNELLLNIPFLERLSKDHQAEEKLDKPEKSEKTKEKKNG